MDPLISNGIDPALLRVIEKRSHERDPQMRRRRAPTSAGETEENGAESVEDSPKHELDDLA